MPAMFRNAGLRGKKNWGARFASGANAAKTREFFANSRRCRRAAESLVRLTREGYPNYYECLSIIFSKVKQKPRVVEEHGSVSAIISTVEAGTGVAIATDFGYSFGNRVKFLHITPEPKPISVGIVGIKGQLSPAAEKFWQCAKEAAAKKIVARV
jgi:DNA-binding transcriptional LysR family regulator